MICSSATLNIFSDGLTFLNCSLPAIHLDFDTKRSPLDWRVLYDRLIFVAYKSDIHSAWYIKRTDQSLT